MSKIIDKQGIAKPAQVGVDLTIADIEAIEDAPARFHNELSTMQPNGKMKLAEYSPLPTFNLVEGLLLPAENGEQEYWLLPKGAYAVTFDQGLEKLNPDENAYIIQRSSLNRAGTRIEGSIFDPGFETEALGATMFVFASILIAKHSRVAQITIEQNEAVEDDFLYDGTWQNKANK